MKDLNQMNALVTGCSGGLGPYIARELARQGANIIAVARSKDRLAEVTNSLRKMGVKALSIAADITDADDRQRILAVTEGELGPVDILVNNAGQHHTGRLHTRSPEMIREVIETSLLAPMLLTRAVLPGMLERRRGHLVHIASLAGKAGLPYLSSYAAAKHGLVGFNHSLQGELKGTNVHSTAICSGFIAGEGMWARFNRKVHPGFGLNKLEPVAKRVVRAIRSEDVEVIINRIPVHPVIMMWSLMPGLATKVFGLIGVDSFMAAVGRQGEGEYTIGPTTQARLSTEL